MKRGVAIALCVAGLAACAGRLPPVATTADAERVHVALPDLEQGRALLIRKCGSCHRPPMPTEHGAGEWPSKLDEMAIRSNLDGEQRRAIEQYLVTMADAKR